MNELKQEKRWVSWKLINKDGKLTKIPFKINGHPASSTDPATWVTYQEIKDKNLPIGIIFTPEETLLGVDIDKCLTDNKITHEQKENIERFIKEANTYCELSPSCTGLHLLLRITSRLTLKTNRKSPYECYTSGRYFTFTEQPYGEDKPIRTVTPEEAENLLLILGYPWGKEEEPIIVTQQATTNLDDSTILDKMFGSKNGSTIKALYNGDISGHDDDESKADAGLLSHLAFWTGKNPSQMERIWLSSPLGSRKKTQSRQDYRTRSISNAISKCKQVYEAPKKREVQITDGEIQFLTTKKFNKDGELIESVIQNTENIARVLRHDKDFAGKFRYDTFRNTIEIFGKHVWRIQEMNDAVDMQTKISIKYPEFSKVGKEMVMDAMILVARENIFDSAVDYIKAQVWDKKPRLDYWLQHTYGVEDNEYHRAVGSNWLKGLVKRIIEPGCKFDHVLVLEGEQGSKKSTSLSILGGQWYVETAMSTDNKDFFMQFQGKAIIEFSEGETLNRTEVKRMKAIITTQVDKYRPPYERLSQDFPRRCVFAMTTNESEYLKDDTGNRRWLPVKLIHEEANVIWLAENRGQIFAEAYHRLTQLKESVHEFPKESTKEEQAKRRIYDPNTDAIVEWYLTSLTDEQREDGVTIMQAYEKVLNKNGGGKIDRWSEITIGNIFKEILKLEKRRVMRHGISSSRYFNVGLLLVQPKDELNIW